MNLGWKLAATIKGSAPAGLLDSYTAEQYPIGAWALDWTRAQISVMRPDVPVTRDLPFRPLLPSVIHRFAIQDTEADHPGSPWRFAEHSEQITSSELNQCGVWNVST